MILINKKVIYLKNDNFSTKRLQFFKKETHIAGNLFSLTFVKSLHRHDQFPQRQNQSRPTHHQKKERRLPRHRNLHGAYTPMRCLGNDPGQNPFLECHWPSCTW